MPRRHRFIQRSDRRSFHGWSVRLTRRRQHQTRFFPDKRYGSKAAALKTALKFRDEQLLILAPPLRLRSFFPRNTTGVVGVTLENRHVGGYLSPRYCAAWPTGDGRICRRSFAIKTYGRGRAFDLAVEARCAGIEEAAGRLRARLARQVGKRHSARGGRAER